MLKLANDMFSLGPLRLILSANVYSNLWGSLVLVFSVFPFLNSIDQTVIDSFG